MPAVLALMFLTGCAAHKPCRNCQYGQHLRVTYLLKDCKDLPAGKFTCKNPVFDPQALDAKAGK